MENALVGLASTSTAPFCSAVIAAAEPACEMELMMMTGMGRCCWRIFRKVNPSMRGISMSSVMTSGFNSLILSRATYGSGAVPTTWISGSLASASVIILRTTEESSTMRTLILSVMVVVGKVKIFLQFQALNPKGIPAYSPAPKAFGAGK